jgi:hypothetical protein
MAHSKLAEELSRESIAAALDMTPEQRLRLALELWRRGVEMYVKANVSTTTLGSRSTILDEVDSRIRDLPDAARVEWSKLRDAGR